MTLISMTPAKDGFVLAADSQETCPSYDEQGNYRELRRSVQKIEPRAFSNYGVAIAGSGNASLIDSFIVRAHRAIEKDIENASAEHLRTLLEDELADFQIKDVVACTDDNKSFQLFIGYCCAATKEHGVWISKNVVLEDLREPALIGDAHELYSEIVDRLFAPGMTVPQAILVSLHVLTIAEATSNSVKGPFSVAIIRENGIWMDDPPFIVDMVSRLKDIEAWTNHVLLACADTSISPGKLGELLTEFSARAVGLHQAQIQRVAQMQVDKGLFIINDSHPRLPPGTRLTIPEMGSISVGCDIDVPDWYKAGWEKLKKMEEERRAKEQATPPDLHTSRDPQ